MFARQERDVSLPLYRCDECSSYCWHLANVLSLDVSRMVGAHSRCYVSQRYDMSHYFSATVDVPQDLDFSLLKKKKELQPHRFNFSLYATSVIYTFQCE